LSEVHLLFVICSVDWGFGSVDTKSSFVALKVLIERSFQLLARNSLVFYVLCSVKWVHFFPHPWHTHFSSSFGTDFRFAHSLCDERNNHVKRLAGFLFSPKGTPYSCYNNFSFVVFWFITSFINLSVLEFKQWYYMYREVFLLITEDWGL